MVVYELITEKDLWNKAIIQNSNFSPYQIYNWGDYKKKMGWKVATIKANDNGDIAYFQISYKQKLNIFIGWCVGSISGSVNLFNKNDLLEFIKTAFDVRYVFIKSNFTNRLDFEESLTLYSAGWNKSVKKINSDYTINVDLNHTLEELVKNCSSNWRRNLKRGQQRNKNIVVSTLSDMDIDQIDALFGRFRNIKDIVLPDKQELEYIKEQMGDKIIVASSFIDNDLVGLRAFLYHGTKAIDFWATTDEVGRKHYTSFPLLFKLFEEAKNLEIKEYDMSGIDPLNNLSVYSFKNGIRGLIVEKLGEWEISNSNIISYLINYMYLRER